MFNIQNAVMGPLTCRGGLIESIVCYLRVNVLSLPQISIVGTSGTYITSLYKYIFSFRKFTKNVMIIPYFHLVVMGQSTEECDAESDSSPNIYRGKSTIFGCFHFP